MNNKEILQKVIEKAQNNGYKLEPRNRGDVFRIQKDLSVKVFTESSICILHKKLFEIIFSQDFAKHFWLRKCNICNNSGSTEVRTKSYILCPNCGGKATTDKYRYETAMDNLQEMVIQKEPVKYLESFL